MPRQSITPAYSFRRCGVGPSVLDHVGLTWRSSAVVRPEIVR